MKTKEIIAVYFSPNGNTKKIVEEIAKATAGTFNCPLRVIDITLPAARQEQITIGADSLMVIGTPTYAGKTPNKLLPYLKDCIKGSGGPAVTVVTYGNRSFDNSLAELAAVMKAGGFRIAGGGAFCCEHAFSDKLAGGRPDEADLAKARELAQAVAVKLGEGQLDTYQEPEIPGDADAPYYIPKGVDGQPVKFLKARPVVDSDKCKGCGTCQGLCPVAMELCIKCQACIKGCPEGARAMEDPAFLSHVKMLEENFSEEIKEDLLFV